MNNLPSAKTNRELIQILDKARRYLGTELQEQNSIVEVMACEDLDYETKMSHVAHLRKSAFRARKGFITQVEKLNQALEHPISPRAQMMYEFANPAVSNN